MTDLHNAIMRIDAKPDADWPAGEQQSYKLGHRDARHAAAELALAAPTASAPDAAQEALRTIREAGGNFSEWAVWAQKMAAWGMQPNKWPRPPMDAPEVAGVPDANASPDPVVETNVALMRQRSAIGIKQYGTTLAASGLSVRALLVHALEESLDQANYIQAAIQATDSALWQVQIRAGDEWRAVTAWDHGHTIKNDTFAELGAALDALAVMESNYDEHSFRAHPINSTVSAT